MYGRQICKCGRHARAPWCEQSGELRDKKTKPRTTHSRRGPTPHPWAQCQHQEFGVQLVCCCHRMVSHDRRQELAKQADLYCSHGIGSAQGVTNNYMAMLDSTRSQSKKHRQQQAGDCSRHVCPNNFIQFCIWFKRQPFVFWI